MLENTGDEFDFDCPQSYCIIGEFTFPYDNDQLTRWFGSQHPLHEKIENNNNLHSTTTGAILNDKQQENLLVNSNGQKNRRSYNFSIHKNDEITMSNNLFNDTTSLTSRSSSAIRPRTVNHNNNIDQNSSKISKLPIRVSSATTNKTISNNKSRSTSTNRRASGAVQTSTNKTQSTSSSKLTYNISQKTTTKIVTNSCNSNISLKAKQTIKTNEKDETMEMINMLKQHNERFVPPTQYEPSRYSVRDVRIWEKQSHKIYLNLKPEEREKANIEIGKMIHNNNSMKKRLN
eukprot:gene14272-19149_t